MAEFQVNIIATSSKGNCVVINDQIMCDAGISRKKIEESGYDLNHLKILIITHKHKDHANLPMIRWAIEHQVMVHIPHAVLDMLRAENRIDMDNYLGVNVFLHEDEDRFEGVINDIDTDNQLQPETQLIHIRLYPQRHHDIVNYAIVIEVGDQRLLYSTDLDTLNPSSQGVGLVTLGDFNEIILEGNYDEIWLRDYIQMSIAAVDDNIDTSTMTDIDLDKWVRANYQQLSRQTAACLFRAVQNMRHLSKQQARLYVRNHLLPSGHYYEVHRSSMFYERPNDWDKLLD